MKCLVFHPGAAPPSLMLGGGWGVQGLMEVLTIRLKASVVITNVNVSSCHGAKKLFDEDSVNILMFESGLAQGLLFQNKHTVKFSNSRISNFGISVIDKMFILVWENILHHFCITRERRRGHFFSFSDVKAEICCSVFFISQVVLSLFFLSQHLLWLLLASLLFLELLRFLPCYRLGMDFWGLSFYQDLTLFAASPQDLI